MDSTKKGQRRALPTLIAGMLWLLLATPLAAEEPLLSGDEVTANALLPWTGDLDGMVERRMVRVLVPYGRTLYFLDGATQRGIAHDVMRAFEDALNEALGTGTRRLSVVFLPTTRDRLIPALEEGLGDVIAANLTVTPERAGRVAFTNPVGRNVRELLVSHRDAPAPADWAELSGRTLFVSALSSYFEHLGPIQAELAARGLAPIRVHEAPAHFQTEDALEMVNAGLVEYTVADSYLAEFWQQVLPDLAVHEHLVLSDHNDIAFAVRPDSPRLLAQLNAFLATTRKGTATGNILFRRYLENTRFVTGATAEAERARLQAVADLFRRHADAHELDWLMMAAQGYQESRLDHSVVSPAGAIGIMQLLPATAADMGVEDVTDLEANIFAGIRYVRHLLDRYFDDPALDASNRVLFALAAYNAGPNRVRQRRRQAAERGLDPDQWFNHVERIAAERIGRETVTYVANIYKYYIAYQLIREQALASPNS